jgi:hypothetical protein
MSHHRLLFALLAALLGSLTHCALAAGSDELWEITTRMEDRTSGFAMPATTLRQCLRKATKTEEMVPMEKDCRLTDQKVSGSKVSFSFECSGRNRMSGRGEIDRPNASTYSGSMQMKGVTEGQKVDMSMNYAGKLAGSCTFGEPVAMPGGAGRPGQMPPGMPAMTPEQMKQLKANPEAMRQMMGGY